MFTQHHLLTKILYLTLLLNKYFSIFFLEMNSTKHSKDNKRKDTELTEEQSTERQKRLEQHITNLEKSVNINKNTNIDPAYIMVINILSYILDVNLCKLTLTFNLLRGTLKKLLESYLRIQYTQHKVNLEK